MGLIEIENLAFTYPNQSQDWRLQVKYLKIDKGKFYSVTGNNMSGKSTLLRILAGLEDIPKSPTFSSELSFQGYLVQKTRKRIGSQATRITIKGVCLLSHDDTMFSELSVWDNVRVARRIAGDRSTKLARADCESYINKLTSRVHIGTLQAISLNTTFGNLSTGGKALVRLARAFAWQTKLLLIDEVTSHLDCRHNKIFFEFLKELLFEGCTIVLISHNNRDHRLASEISLCVDTDYIKVTVEPNGVVS